MPGSYSNASKHPPAILWVVLVLIVIAGLVTKAAWDHEHRKAVHAHQQVELAIQKQATPYEQIMRNIWSIATNESAFRKAMGIDQVNTWTSPSPRLNQYHRSWIDTATGFEVGIMLDSQGKIVGTGWTAARVPPAPHQAADPIQRFIGKVWQGGSWVWFMVWFSVLVFYFWMPHRRAWLAFVFVATTSLMITLGHMGPGMYLDIYVMQNNDSLVYHLIMFLVTFFGVASGGFTNRVKDLLACQRCGYSLKGNTSGICPECGAGIPPKQLAQIDNEVR